jgi:hypothetical protein
MNRPTETEAEKSAEKPKPPCYSKFAITKFPQVDGYTAFTLANHCQSLVDVIDNIQDTCGSPVDEEDMDMVRYIDDFALSTLSALAPSVSSGEDAAAITPAALAVEPGAGSLPVELDGVADAIADARGMWRSCSGCHETNEGVPLGPFSNVLKCNLGMGCFECGGIGAIWDTTDYADMGRALTPASSAVGWKLVPEEPTAFMISQGVSCDWRRGDDTIRNIWRSMVEASPTAEKCPTCDGTGKEGRHSICRDCDKAPASSAVEGEAVAWLTPYYENDRAGKLVPVIVPVESVIDPKEDWTPLYRLPASPAPHQEGRK